MGADLSVYSRTFEPHIRVRGAEYFRYRRAKIISLHPGRESHLRIKGTRLYDVRLRFNEFDQLIMTCTCPYSARGYHCKHIWAGILEANRHNFFSSPTQQNTDLEAGGISREKSGSDSETSLDSKAIKLSQSANTIKSRLDPNLPLPWQTKLARIKTKVEEVTKPQSILQSTMNAAPRLRVGTYGIDWELSRTYQQWAIRFFYRERRVAGDLGPLRSCSVSQEFIPIYEGELDRKVLWAMMGLSTFDPRAPLQHEPALKSHLFLDPKRVTSLFQELGAARKLYSLTSQGTLQMLEVDLRPLQIRLELAEKSGGDYVLHAALVQTDLPSPDRDDTDLPPSEVHQAVLPWPTARESLYLTPFLLIGNRLLHADFGPLTAWFELFLAEPTMTIPAEELSDFLAFYFSSAAAPKLLLPEALSVTHSSLFHQVRLVVTTGPRLKSIQVSFQFLYGQHTVEHSSAQETLFDSGTRTLYQRNFQLESEAIVKLDIVKLDIGKLDRIKFERIAEVSFAKAPLVLSEELLAPLIEDAFALGWEVVAYNKKVTQNRDLKGTVASGIDWFDLSLQFVFANGQTLGIPQLLKNLKSGQKFISLADGSTGLIREDWLQKFGRMAQMGALAGENLRLTKIQALFFGTELSEDEHLRVDRKFKTFQNLIHELNSLETIKAGSIFHGTLRSYQKKGLSWLNLMSTHGLGAILADDMGLGKTIQVLATLSLHPKAKTLIVAPKSLVHNWIDEAKKFTPDLKFFNHTGAQRLKKSDHLETVDVLVTTYHTLRLDIEFLKNLNFDFLILDEAHYIKNSESQVFMACRLLQARMKIALSGTPVENSLADLFSILSIVTPGLITDSLANKYAKETQPEALSALSRSLSPFLLRRTKDEVLKDLPAKSEQVLYCELSPSERRKYNELKNHYWNSLNGKFDQKGFASSKIDILEALLRLRQASCHPGLLNKEMAPPSSAKFDLLIEQLENVIADGHKALIFSQFTSLLDLLKPLLEGKNIAYESLDGRTHDRSRRVTRFQENPEVKAFLISLKAGGVGLNLTAADYVFVLDPWWNPAAESQAIDRAHRIGQTKKVFAYKLIAKDTVEEKILSLQEKKKALAKAVISNETSLLKGLKLEDLKELFS